MMLRLRSRASDRGPQRNGHVGATDRPDRFIIPRGADAVARLQEVIREGNVLRIWIKNKDGRPLIEIPSLLGVRGGIRLQPVWAAVTALASASGQLTIEVQREAAWPRYED